MWVAIRCGEIEPATFFAAVLLQATLEDFESSSSLVNRFRSTESVVRPRPKCLISALVLGMWMTASALFLMGFLLISVLHLSGDLLSEAGVETGAVRRVLYGVSI